ncbi:hypothetical protein CK3_26060 [butyrate-producing bacterium SS3/4]|nr:hypothetical protein CK3_26060 [butyrate-producing bacterium SS3/4]
MVMPMRLREYLPKNSKSLESELYKHMWFMSKLNVGFNRKKIRKMDCFRKSRKQK